MVAIKSSRGESLQHGLVVARFVGSFAGGEDELLAVQDPGRSVLHDFADVFDLESAGENFSGWASPDACCAEFPILDRPHSRSWTPAGVELRVALDEFQIPIVIFDVFPVVPQSAAADRMKRSVTEFPYDHIPLVHQLLAAVKG